MLPAEQRHITLDSDRWVMPKKKRLPRVSPNRVKVVWMPTIKKDGNV